MLNRLSNKFRIATLYCTQFVPLILRLDLTVSVRTAGIRSVHLIQLVVLTLMSVQQTSIPVPPTLESAVLMWMEHTTVETVLQVKFTLLYNRFFSVKMHGA